ncbi:translation initiation factor 2 subunit 1 [Nematocida sp. LUAm3]|nr:translation initiation factor 2 subunit 1 [Nematocida sp. LUAm3]KAI5173527.1 translation initiation factor 2 subunit 1 [Nematocida sp. LUAm2]KAI5176748.1 translation initiation factor 2 subunit 1 [Nematocida sp. LUAm1]
METNQTHRYYLEEFPKEGEVVVGRIKSLTDIGAYVSLPEYNEIEGLIVYGELTKKRTRNVHKLIKVGSLEGFLVMKVDKDKGYIDLSKKRAQYEEKVTAFERYYKGKIAHNFMQSIAIKTNVSLDQLYEEFGWELEKEFGSIYKAFRESLGSEHLFQRTIRKSKFLTEKFLEEIEKLIKLKLVVPKIKVRADAETKCNKGNGVVVIKEILTRIKKEHPNVEIALVSSPVFSFSVMSEDGETGERALKELLEKVEKRVLGEGGEYKMVMEPTLFGPKPQFDNESEDSGEDDSSGESV